MKIIVKKDFKEIYSFKSDLFNNHVEIIGLPREILNNNVIIGQVEVYIYDKTDNKKA